MNTSLFSGKRLFLSLVAAGVIGGVIGANQFGISNANALDTPTTVNPTPAGLPSFADITSANGPAVVNISIVGETVQNTPASMPPGITPDDPRYEFFKRFFPNGGAEQRTPVRGQGSGFIIQKDGLILTNAHVVKDATEVTVKLSDRREFTAKVLGADERTDVAVIKIEADNLPTVKLGSSEQLRVGDWVLAIGSPYGLTSTVTAGVVSAKERALPDDSSVAFIQTDAAINPGNSGGPLFNSQGEVIGINSQIYSRTGGYQGLAFAIPIEVAQQIKDQIVQNGVVQHARLGISIQEVNQALADSFSLPTPEGALVSGVEPDSAADKAGLQQGDVIRRINGKKIVAASDLPAYISMSKPNEEVSLEVWRHGKQITLSARLSKTTDVASNNVHPEAQQGKLGLALRPLTPDEKKSNNIAYGLLISGVSGPAAKAGIRNGDLLLSINGKQVNDPQEVKALLEKSGKSVALLIQREGNKIFVPITINP